MLSYWESYTSDISCPVVCFTSLKALKTLMFLTSKKKTEIVDYQILLQV